MCDECLDREIVASVSIEIIYPCVIHLEKHKDFLDQGWKKELFVVKNLFYLLSKLRSLNIQLISQEEGLDFSYTKESIIGLIYGPKKLREYNWLGFIGDTLPKLQQSQRDLKKELVKRFDEHLMLFMNTCVAMSIPHIIKYLSICDTGDKPENAKEIQKAIKGEGPQSEVFKKDEIKRLMHETQKTVYENLVRVLQMIEQSFAGEIYTQLRNELLVTVTQEITKCVQKWYDKLSQLMDVAEFESLDLPNIKIMYETVSKAIAAIASSSALMIKQ